MDPSKPTGQRQFKIEETATSNTEKEAVEMEEEVINRKDNINDSVSFLQEQNMLNKPCSSYCYSNDSVTNFCSKSQLGCGKQNSERIRGYCQPARCCHHSTPRETVVTFEPDQRGNHQTTYTKMFEKPSKEYQTPRGMCQYFMCTSVSSCLLSCLIVVPLCVFLVRSMTNDTEKILVENSEPFRESPRQHEPLVGGDTARVGRFELNQSALLYEHEIRWLATSATSSTGFQASENDSCVSVPDSGLYHVISQITFAFKKDTVLTAGQSIALKHRDTMALTFIQKELSSLPFRDPKLNENQKIFMPTNLLVFVEAHAGDWVCVRCNPDLMYVSQVDNVLSIYKL